MNEDRKSKYGNISIVPIFHASAKTDPSEHAFKIDISGSEKPPSTVTLKYFEKPEENSLSSYFTSRWKSRLGKDLEGTFKERHPYYSSTLEDYRSHLQKYNNSSRQEPIDKVIELLESQGKTIDFIEKISNETNLKSSEIKTELQETKLLLGEAYEYIKRTNPIAPISYFSFIFAALSVVLSIMTASGVVIYLDFITSIILSVVSAVFLAMCMIATKQLKK